MRLEHVQYLSCPRCGSGVKLDQASFGQNERVETGLLRCLECEAEYPIVRFIPRFVPDEGYVSGFGLEWTRHNRTQFDRDSGLDVSSIRFFEETQWPRHLPGETVIEVGSGSGRFTEHALSTGAVVLSLDYSRAVEANYESNGHHENLLLVQGDLFHLPFQRDVADRVFCFGVLQHTPDPRSALHSIAEHIRPGGHLVADIYAKTVARYILGTKYWVRPLTRRVPPDTLYRLTSRYVDFMWPVFKQVRRVPKLGRAINWRLLLADYSDLIDDDDVLRDWARLDTFDMLAPRYDRPATARTARRWCAEIGLASIDVRRGYNGYEIRARRPAA